MPGHAPTDITAQRSTSGGSEHVRHIADTRKDKQLDEFKPDSSGQRHPPDTPRTARAVHPPQERKGRPDQGIRGDFIQGIGCVTWEAAERNQVDLAALPFVKNLDQANGQVERQNVIDEQARQIYPG
jgi:hypothetical protein